MGALFQTGFAVDGRWYGRPSPFRFVVGSCFHKTDFSHFLSPVADSVREYILSTELKTLRD